MRHYLPVNVPEALIKRLLRVIDFAPTAENRRELIFSLVDDLQQKKIFLARLMQYFEDFLENVQLPENLLFMERFLPIYRKKGVDVLFRGAPHFIIASAPKNALSPVTDCAIALSYLELFAPTMGLGTVWSELARVMIEEVLPELKNDLQIPENYLLGGVIAFGYPAVTYVRTVQREESQVKIYNATGIPR